MQSMADPRVKTMSNPDPIRKTIIIHDRHERYLQDADINFSALVRQTLDQYMEYQRTHDDFNPLGYE